MKKACVIGWPVSHSLSPVIHGYWLREHGVGGDYVRAPVEPGQFETFFKGLASQGFCGGNITVPHKIEAYRLCDVRDEAATAIGAVNTVWLSEGKLIGTNTDAYGFLANLDADAPGWDSGGSAAVIGAGGAARAIVWALVSRGFSEIRIVNRTKRRADELASEFAGVQGYGFDALNEALRDASFAVNCSTLGMTGAPPLEVSLVGLRRNATVCDIVYHPLETGLLRQAREKGFAAVGGLGMLLHQAVPGFEKWFGVRPQVSAGLKQAVLSAIGARESSE